MSKKFLINVLNCCQMRNSAAGKKETKDTLIRFA